MKTPQELLTDVEAIMHQRRALVEAQETALRQLLTPEHYEQWQHIQQEYTIALTEIDRWSDACKEAVREAILRHGKTLKGEQWQAVYVPGRDRWDTDALILHAQRCPEVMQCRVCGRARPGPGDGPLHALSGP